MLTQLDWPQHNGHWFITEATNAEAFAEDRTFQRVELSLFVTVIKVIFVEQ